MKRTLASSLLIATSGLLLILIGGGTPDRVIAANPPVAAEAPMRPGSQPSVSPAGTPAATNSGPVASPAGTELNVFFSGRRQSALEPCGCHTAQRGGVQYEQSLYANRADVPALRVDAGEWAIHGLDKVPVEMMKTRYLLRALARMDYDAVNFGWSDIQLSPAFFQSLREQHPDALAPLVSANVTLKSPDQGGPIMKPSRIVERQTRDGKTIKIGITGATTGLMPRQTTLPVPAGMQRDRPVSPHYEIKPEIEALKPVIEQLRGQVDLVVVLYDGGLEDVAKLVKAVPGIQILVTTARTGDASTLVNFESGTMVLTMQNRQGKEIGYVPLRRENERWIPASRAESLYVSLDLPVAAPLQAVIEEFKKETKSLEVLPKGEVKKIFAGADACRDCHVAEFRDWEQTQHGHALRTLVERGQQSNPECLKCHVVGFQKDNGFYSVTHNLSQMMGNVQCENCHGPAKEHADIQQMLLSGKFWMEAGQLRETEARARKAVPPKVVAEETCLQCHTPENDNTWNYQAKVPKVDHNPATIAPPSAVPSTVVMGGPPINDEATTGTAAQ